MRVVMVTDFPRRAGEMGGGVEAVAFYLASELRKLPDIEVEAVTLDRWGGKARTELQDGLPVHFVTQSTRPSRLSNLENVRRMAETIRSLNPDIVHAHIANQYADAAIASDRPWVLTAHGVRHLEADLRPGLVSRYRSWLVRREEFRIMRRAPHLISISPFINNVFGDTINAATTLIDNPVAGSFFDIQAQPVPGQILYAGRLIPRKDIMTLLKAFHALQQRLPHARLRLAGDGVLGREPTGYPLELTNYIRQHGLEDKITFLGQLDDATLQKEYASASVLAVSSILETAPMVILQALAAGVPVVSTDAGGIRYLVDEDQTGYVVPIGDADALADGLFKVLGREDSGRSMGVRAREVALQRFAAPEIARKTLEVYRGVLK